MATWQRAGRVEPWTLRAGFCRESPEGRMLKLTRWPMLPWILAGVVWFKCPPSFTDVVLHSVGACRGNPGGESSCAAIVSVRAAGVWRRVALRATWATLPTTWPSLVVWNLHASFCSHCFPESMWWSELLPGRWLLSVSFPSHGVDFRVLKASKCLSVYGGLG